MGQDSVSDKSRLQSPHVQVGHLHLLSASAASSPPGYIPGAAMPIAAAVIRSPRSYRRCTECGNGLHPTVPCRAERGGRSRCASGALIPEQAPRPYPERVSDPRTAADLLVECLENEGVTHVFGIPGEENIRFMDALSRLVRSGTCWPATSRPPRSWPRCTAGSPAGRGLLRDARPGSDQPAARRRRRHDQQHAAGRRLRPGGARPQLQGVPPGRRPGRRCSRR